MKTAASKIKVAIPGKSYDVVVGPGALQTIGQNLKQFKSKKAFIIADQNIADARVALRQALDRAGWQGTEIAVPAGENLKSFQQVYALYGELLKAKADRQSVIFALGGGSVGDAAGFVAATYLRGIPWVGVPTSLLAQVDSAIGGKTGINHSLGKNLIGAFHQPSLVVCDTRLLKTLGSRELLSGLGEIVKYGIVFDAKFLQYFEDHWQEALNGAEAPLAKFIAESVKWKAKVVAKDEFDRKGLREVLNFGHTFGHALESATYYQGFQHGEAVIWGMRFALALSVVRKKLSAKNYAEVFALLAALPAPPLPAKINPREYFAHMARDKKVREGKVNFVLLKRPGLAVSDSGVSEQDLVAAFKLMLESSGGTP